MATNNSSLITAPSKSKAESLKLSAALPSTVHETALNVDIKAEKLFNNMANTSNGHYVEMKRCFQNLSENFLAAKKQISNSQTLEKNLAKVSNACKNQATYCGNRRLELISAYRYDKLQNSVSILEQMFAKFSSYFGGNNGNQN